jgi:hypothetical protein
LLLDALPCALLDSNSLLEQKIPALWPLATMFTLESSQGVNSRRTSVEMTVDLHLLVFPSRRPKHPGERSSYLP